MGVTAGLAAAHLRVARPTDDLDTVVRFYRDGLGFEVGGGFRDHDGFDGVMLGHPGAGYHLEFTRKAGHPAGRAPTEDNLLVFYLPDRAAWETAVGRMAAAGYAPVPAFNPYWDRSGRTFQDPDGYRVVIQNAAWPAGPGTRPVDSGPHAGLLDLLPVRAGHFALESGHHGDVWLDLNALFLRPAKLRPFVAHLAGRLAPHGVEAVCGPLTGGAFLAQAVAAELDAEFCFAGRVAGDEVAGRCAVGFRVPESVRTRLRGRRVAVVDDAINAGSAVRATVADLKARGAVVVAVGALATLGGAATGVAAELGVPLECVCRMPGGLWPPAECPLCAAGILLEKPGGA